MVHDTPMLEIAPPFEHSLWSAPAPPNVLFLMPPLTADEVLAQLTPRDGVDTAAGGDGVVYFENRMDRASQSRLGKIVGMPFYPRITIRNWRTTTTLLRMLDERAA